MSKEKKPPYVPTRTCPHRWCKPLHLAPLPFFLAVFAFDLWHNWRMLVMLVAVIFGAYWVQKIVHFKPRRTLPASSQPVKITHVLADLRESPSAMDLEMEDAKYEGTGWRMLEVRKGWARAAVACDLFFVLLIGTSAVEVFSDPAAEARETEALRLDGTAVIGLLIGLAVFAFTVYAHRKATKPRKPKRERAWVPGFLRTSGSS